MIETKRMQLRELREDDFENAAEFLRDEEVMHAWEHAFSDDEVTEWIRKNIERNKKDGCGCLLAINRDTGEVIGGIGLIFNRDINGEACWEFLYIIKKKYWGKGYAKEGAAACLKYGFEVLCADKIIAQMRTNNMASAAVAISLSMDYVGEYDRIYMGKVMPHAIYAITKKEWEQSVSRET